ncbi:hypothetical protein LXL04_020124 [Taraxacum kok-saghyz]
MADFETDQVFTTRENLKEWVDNVARNLGWGVARKRFSRYGNEFKVFDGRILPLFCVLWLIRLQREAEQPHPGHISIKANHKINQPRPQQGQKGPKNLQNSSHTSKKSNSKTRTPDRGKKVRKAPTTTAAPARQSRSSPQKIST